MPPEEPESWDELPEIDGGLDEPELEGPVDGEPTIPLLDEADARDRDDTNAYDLDIGVELDPGPEPAEEAPQAELVLDIGQLLAEEDESSLELDDDSGPIGFDVSAGIQELPAPELGADDEGANDRFEDLVDEALPALDADEEGDFDDSLNISWFDPELARDEALPEWSGVRWREHEVPVVVSALSAATLVGSTLVVAGRELVVLEREKEVRRLGVEGSTAISVVLGDTSRDSILYATALGRLLRRRLGASAEACDGWRAVAGVSVTEAAHLELCQPSAALPSVLLARTSTGVLLRSTDFGSSFQRLDFGGSVVALSSAMEPALVLIANAGRHTLLRSDDAGASFRTLELDPAARGPAQGRAPLLCARNRVIAVADEARGLAVSYDGGAHFARIPGCANTTALAIGTFGGVPTLWLSAFDEMSDRTSIVQVQDGAAARVAELHSPTSEALQESSEAVRVAALVWDAPLSHLWAAGNFGLKRLTPSNT